MLKRPTVSATAQIKTQPGDPHRAAWFKSLNTKVLTVSIVEMTGLCVGTLRTHEMAEFKCDGLVVIATLGGLQLHAQLVKFNGEEADGHIAVKALGVGPALHAVLVGQLLVH